jgi:tetratricopeptide (TPR) repeat protein
VYILVTYLCGHGTSYRTRFTYNPKKHIIRHYHHGLSLLNSVRYSDIALGSCVLTSFINGRFAPGYSSLADSLLRLSLISHFTSQYNSLYMNISEVKGYCDSALEIDPAYWHAHYMLGAVESWRRDWNAAKKSFAKAFELDPVKAANCVYYPAFLLAVGEVERALAMVRTTARMCPGDVLAQFAAALFLHVTHNFGEAQEYINGPLFAPIHQDNWLALSISVMNMLALGDLTKVDRLLSRPEQQDMWHSYSMRDNSLGLIALVRAEQGNRAEAQAILVSLLEDPDNRPEQIAMAHMAVGQIEEAIAVLRANLDDGNPMWMWLNLWPVFDPLKGHPAFKDLLAHMGLPCPD